MVVQLLVLRRGVSHQGASGDAQVGTCVVQGGVYQEVFLFPSQVGIYALYLREEHAAYFGRCFVYGGQCFQQRSLVVERFAGVRYEYGRDTQGRIDDEGRGGNVPCRVSACFKCIADASVGETGGVGLLLDEKLAGEAGDAVTFDQVVAISDDTLKVGADVAKATVSATVMEQGRDKKVIVYKYKRKTGYHKKNGHRESFTRVKIEKINA